MPKVSIASTPLPASKSLKILLNASNSALCLSTLSVNESLFKIIILSLNSSHQTLPD